MVPLSAMVRADCECGMWWKVSENKTPESKTDSDLGSVVFVSLHSSVNLKICVTIVHGLCVARERWDFHHHGHQWCSSIEAVHHQSEIRMSEVLRVWISAGWFHLLVRAILVTSRPSRPG